VTRPYLSVVVPIRNESPNIPELHRQLTETLERWGKPYEILAIDDGSTDDSFGKLAPQLRTDGSLLRGLRARAGRPHRHL